MTAQAPADSYLDSSVRHGIHQGLRLHVQQIRRTSDTENTRQKESKTECNEGNERDKTKMMGRGGGGRQSGESNITSQLRVTEFRKPLDIYPVTIPPVSCAYTYSSNGKLVLLDT